MKWFLLNFALTMTLFGLMSSFKPLADWRFIELLPVLFIWCVVIDVALPKLAAHIRKKAAREDRPQ